MEDPSDTGELHPIQVAVRRSGVSADLLRAWEKRYGAVRPTRTEGGRRLYSDADIERLRLIREAMAGGRRVGDVAHLPASDIAQMVGEDAKEHAVATTLRSSAAHPFMADAIAATQRADQGALRAVLSRALLALTPARFITELATPLMQDIGARWERGELSPGHEHAATEVMRRIMTELLSMLPAAPDAPSVVVATLTGQRHELGAMFAAAGAALEEWRVIYLGADLPAADIARVSLDTGARAVALSITTPHAHIAAELETLRATLGPDVPIVIGGQHADSPGSAVGGSISVVRSIEAFRQLLRSIAVTP